MKIKTNIDTKGVLKSVKDAAKKALEKKEIELSCKCGHKIRKSLRWLQDNKNFICPSCGALFDNKELGKILKTLGD